MIKPPWVEAFRPNADEALGRQITGYLRDAIQREVIEVGVKLPPLRDLADMWNTNYFTLHLAMSPLVSEGLLVRRRRLGTFVRKAQKALTHVGTYIIEEVLQDYGLVYYAVLRTALEMRLAKQGVNSVLWVDRRIPSQRTCPPADMLEAIRERRIQGLIVPLKDAQIGPWIRELNIPKSFTSTIPEPGSAMTDESQMVRLAVKYFAESGCQSVGMACHIPAHFDDSRKKYYQDSQIYTKFMKAAARAGLRCKPSWIFTPEGEPENLEKVGYDLSGEFVARTDRPQGLFLFPDVAARGFVNGLLKAGTRVPRDVRLVIHRNAEIDSFCPLEAAHIVTTVGHFADALIRQVRRQLAGEEVGVERIRVRLEAPK